MDYWNECISEALDDAGVSATPDQINIVAAWAEGAHENYGMSHGYDAIPSYSELEVNRLKRELDKERRKISCHECSGRGELVSHGPCHSATSQCWKCCGAGRVDP